MESVATALVIAELNQVHDLARKLRENLNASQIELCKTVAQEIIFSIERTISAAKSSCDHGAELMLSKGRDQQFCYKEQGLVKKRKMMPRWTNQVSVSVGEGELTHDDGHSWRKYGQKDILGAKYPRAYYRCTHRKTQGCSAMKQVQRCDENASIFDVTYLGTHTCSSSMHQPASSSMLYESQQSLLLNWSGLHDFQTCLEVKTESSYEENQDPNSFFSFTSTPIEGKDPENEWLCNSQDMVFDCGESFSSGFVLSSEGDSELAEIISAATSAPTSTTHSPVVDGEFMAAYGGLASDVQFDTSIFFV